jgi:GDP-L-fucose synthase
MKLSGKKVLVTGGTGMVGQPLVDMLVEKGAGVTVASLDNPDRVTNPNIKFVKADLRLFTDCLSLTSDKDIVFHVAGVKGSPTLTKTKPASFFVPMLQFNTNVLEAARLSNVGWTLYTSTVGVYGPAETFVEDDVWNQFPSKNDWFAGWAKRIGELQLEAYDIQYRQNNSSIVRPVNIYGRYDNFNPETSMVIPSLIHRVLEAKDELVVWGDGSPVRDFVNSRDVAAAMIHCVENEITKPVNIGSGKGVSIRELVETVVKVSGKNLKIVWDTTKPNGDAYRVADTTRLNDSGFTPTVTLEEGIRDTLNWYESNRNITRYDVFKA